MAGREDFGILRSRFLTDDRAGRAADLYAEKGLAREDMALATVCGHITQLGLWAMRETDDGVLPGDGVAVVNHATLMPRSACRLVIELLTEAKLLRPVEGGLYLVGFLDCYASILNQRASNREYARNARKAPAEKPETEAKNSTSAPRGVHVGSTSDLRRTPPTVPAVPAVPSGTERNGTAGSLDSHPVVSGGAALASDAAAAPPSATVGERNGTTASPLRNPRCAAHQIRQPCGVCEIAEQAAKRRLEGTTRSSTADIAARVRSQISILADAATPPTADPPKTHLEPPPDDAETRKRIREALDKPPS